jgi:hypothetical protein
MQKEEFICLIKKIAPTFGEKRQLFSAQYKPEAESKALQCFNNAFNKFDKDGGGVLFGWTFIYKISPLGRYLIATNHAVWKSPEGYLIDVTPYENDIPFSNNGKILFLADANANPIKTKTGEFALPNRYFPIDDSPELYEYLRKLTKKEQKEVAKIGEKG